MCVLDLANYILYNSDSKHHKGLSNLELQLYIYLIDYEYSLVNGISLVDEGFDM